MRIAIAEEGIHYAQCNGLWYKLLKADSKKG